MTTLRPVRLPDDLDALWRVAVACEAEVLDEPITTREEIRSQLESPEADIVDGVRVALDDDGEMVGFVAIEVDEVGTEVMVDAYARPGAGSEVLDLLLGHGVAYAKSRAPAGVEGWYASAGVLLTDVPYAQAVAQAGFRPVRRFHRMKVEHTELIEPPVVPSGWEITAVGEDDAGQRAVHSVLEEAFAEHWRHVHHPWDDWIGYFRNRGYDPTQWYLATVDGAPVGALVGNETSAELGSTYVSMLGVLKPFRGQGIARALLLTAFAEGQRRGRTSARLGVDTENGTGAPALYASLGMTPAEVVDAYELPLA